MTHFLRNREIRWQLCADCLLVAIFSAAGFLCAPVCGVLTLLVGLAMMAVHGIATYWRYQRIAQLSTSIDRVLHGNDRFELTGYEEGELAVLASEIEKMTVRLRDAAEKLQQDKQWLLDAMADISHQLRTPLTAMNLTVSMLAEEDLPYQRRLALTHRLRSLLARMDWLVEGLLKMSKIDAGAVSFQREQVPVMQVVEKAAEPLAIAMELRGQTLNMDVGDCSIVTDPAWTAEAIGNILKNCMEHTPEQGTITVRAEQTAIFTKLVISDTGSGFAKEDLPHLFERFYKGKNASDGSVGIGLALCRMILQAQNATITAGQGAVGAVFTIKFYNGAV